MNLVEQLLKADSKKATEKNTGSYKSKKLAKLLGADSPVEISIQEIDTRRLNDILAFQVDKKGNVDLTKSLDSKLLCCVEGITEPSMRDKELQAHFGCATPKDLALTLFGFEVTAISDAICELSGVTDEDTEEEIKN
jgi:hypothetical protein